MANASGKTHVRLSRDLGLFDITMIGVGAMIGAGIFVLTGIAAGTAGPALILSFALNGIVTIFTAMVYAELGSSIPEAGGGYLWVKEGLPGPNAFQAGWMSWFAHAVAGSLYALGFGSYLMLVFAEFGITFPGLNEKLLHKGLAVILVLVFLGINFRGVSETGKVGNIVTVLKVIIIAIFIVSGVAAIFKNPEYLNKFHDFAPKGWPGIFSAMGLTFIAFEGYEIIVQAGEEVKNPRKNIPRAVFLSLAIVIPIYILVAFAAIGAVNPETEMPTYQWLGRHAELGIAEAARQFMPFGTLLLLIGGLLSTMSALNATTFSSTRVSFAMGRDKNLPNLFADVNERTRTPHMALIFSGILIVFMAVVIPIQDVAAAADIMFLLLFLQVNIAVMTLRKKYGDRLRYGYLMPLFPIVPIIGIVTKLFLALFMFHYSPIAWYFTLFWLAAGFLTYYLYVKPRKEVKERTPVVLQELRSIEAQEDLYQVLVPIANPASVPNLLKPAIQAAKLNNGKVILLNVIAVPDQLPLSAGRMYIEKGKSLAESALKMLEKEEIPAEVLIRIAHRPADAITQTALERDVDLLIMGWRGKSRSRNTAIGKNIDRIIQRVNCEVLVLQQEKEPPYKRILIPVADLAQLKAAVRAARLVGLDGKSKVDIIHVFSPGTPEEDRKRFMDELKDRVKEAGENAPPGEGAIQFEEVVARNPVSAIAAAAKDYDCVIVGATRESWIRQKLLSTLPTKIAQKVEPPVVLIHPKTVAVAYGLRRLLGFFRGGYKEIDPTSERELREEGILLPEEKRRTKKLEPSVNRVLFLAVAGIGLASVAAIYLGDGETLTWAGVGGFFVALGLFTYVSVKGSGT